MTNRASVIIASWGRPSLLRRACLSVHQQSHHPLELIVVADAAGLAAIADLPFAARIKTAAQTEANLSAARNGGIALAGGDICAFLDDDAAAEPGWLTALSGALDRADAATGPVLGRNGISLQWGQVALSRDTGERAGAPGMGEALKLHGTNMAVRRDVLVAMGGFDEAFRYYLDDADLSWRLAERSARAAYVEGATVHHAYAESARRAPDRTPRDLTDIAAGQALFLAKHAGGDPDATANFAATQRARVAEAVSEGRLDAVMAHDLTEGLRRGLAEGAERAHHQHPTFPPAAPFQPLRDAPQATLQVIAGRRFRHRALWPKAQAAAATGTPVALFLFEPTIRAHRVQFTDDGVWVQSGGRFGPSDRTQPRFRYWRFSKRLAVEMARFGPTSAMVSGPKPP